MERHEVIFKGTKDGLTITLPENVQTEKLISLFEERLIASNGFFRGAEAILDLGTRTLDDGLIRTLDEVAQRHGIRLTKAIGMATVTRNLAVGGDPGGEELSGPSLPAEKLRDKMEERRASVSNEETLLLKRNFRSGQRLSYHGNVVVVGDINPGAEIVAGGDIIVMGALRGLAHAGAPDNHDAVVMALRLCPTQLRIADVIARAPDGQDRSPQIPEVARIRGKAIVIEGLV